MTQVPTDQPQTLDEMVSRLCVLRAQMPERLRVIADGFIERPREMAVLSISEAAASMNVSPSALVRFGKMLGFDGFAPMQKMLRRSAVSGEGGYRERLRAMAADGRRRDIDYVFDAFSGANIRALEEARKDLDLAALDRIVGSLRKARLIGVAGVKRAFPLAAYLHYGLLRLDMPSLLMDGIGGMADRQIAALGSRDVLVVISFAPYAAEIVAMAEAARARGIPVVAITDSPDGAIARSAAECVFVREGTINDIRAIAVTSTVIQTVFVALGLDDATAEQGGN
jgi:DNA-binding MurR/RpiR family transcriptional regulator